MVQMKSIGKTSTGPFKIVPRLILVAAVMVLAAPAFLWAQQGPPRDDRPSKDPAERIAEYLAHHDAPGSVEYRQVAPQADQATPLSASAGHSTSKKAIDLEVTYRAYAEMPAVDGQTPKQVFDAFVDEVVKPAATQENGGAAVRDAMQSEPWASRLIRATVATQDPNGGDSPKAIKKLIESGRVSKEHAALMWAARNALVHEALGLIQQRLQSAHPGWKFQIDILDSGSYGSIASDIDKTLHLVAWDEKGQPVETFGPNGRVLGGNIKAFLDLAFESFNRVGREKYGASHDISKALDTEFFGSDTLPKRLAAGAVYTSDEHPLSRIAGELRQQFANLQRNPGPSYQFIGTVIAQVIGRTVEQDVNLRDKLRELRALRGRIDQLSDDQRVGLVLDEAMALTHAPASVARMVDGKLKVEPIDVTEFLEQNGLAIRYTNAQAAEQAVGNYEKLVHKTHAIIDKEGNFHSDKFDLYLNDLAKYFTRGAAQDLATNRFPDEDPDKPAAFGDFDRRFGPADAMARFHLDREPPNARPYTRQVHDELYRPILENLYARPGRPDARTGVDADLELFWRTIRASETVMALKADPGLAGKLGSRLQGYPYDAVFKDMIDWISENEPERFGDMTGMDEPSRLNHMIEVSKRLYAETTERALMVAISGNLDEALSLWLKTPRTDLATGRVGELDRIRINENYKLARLKRQRDELMRKVVAPDSPEAEQRHRDLATYDEKIERVSRLIRQLETDPSETVRRIHMLGLDSLRRMFDLFHNGEDPAAYQRMLQQLPEETRRDVEIMERVWAVKAAQPEQSELASRYGIDLTRLGNMTREVAGRLAKGYAEHFGIDFEEIFRKSDAEAEEAGLPPNHPARVALRYLQKNYYNMTGVQSSLNLLKTWQQAERLPLNERLQLLGDTALSELVSNTPMLGHLYTMWSASQADNNVQAAGGALGLVREIAGIMSPELAEHWAVKLGGHLGVALTMIRTLEEMYAYESFEPIQDHFFQLVWKGYVDRQKAGLIRAGTLQVDSRIPVTPIVQVGVPYRFLYLKAEWARRYLDELQAAGDNRAAAGLLFMAGLDENLPQTEIAHPLMIDLGTDFDGLLGRLQQVNFRSQSMAPGLSDRLDLARAAVLEVLKNQRALREATLKRIGADRRLRRALPGHQNLWLLASRENMGMALDAEFSEQEELLYQSLVGLKEARQKLAAQAGRAWSEWKALAPPQEFLNKTREAFLQVMSPRKVYEKRLAALQSELKQASGSSLTAPVQMFKTQMDRTIKYWTGVTTSGADQRQKRVRTLERRMAGMGAFTGNSYVNARTPTEPYRLQEAISWYGTEIMKWREFIARLPQKEPAPGLGLGDLLADAEGRLGRMQGELNLLLGGFAEADAAVAPKVAQGLLLDWLAGKPPYDNDVHTALKFVWHDAATQKRIRDRLVKDLVRGRQLIPMYRSLSSSWQGMLESALADAGRDYRQLVDDRIQQAAWESAELAEAMADLRQQPALFPSQMQLHVDPYLLQNRKGLSVGVDCRVDRDIYRAAEVQVKDSVEVIPLARAEPVLGSQVWRRALAQSGLKPEQVLFVVRVEAAVTSATPMKGYQPYTDLPHSGPYLLLVPDRSQPPAPGSPGPLPEAKVTVCALGDGAPLSPTAADLASLCDPARVPVLSVDRVAVFFTPARDLREPVPDDRAFAWRIVDPGGRGVRSGYFFTPGPGGGGIPTTPLLPAGAPGRFGVLLPAGLAAGSYRIQSADARVDNSGLLGQGGSGISGSGRWRDEGRFELAGLTLHFQGFVAEQVRDLPLVDRPGLAGTLTLDQPVVNGTTVRLDATARWSAADVAGEQRAHGRLSLSFPNTLTPQGKTLGTVGIELKNLEIGEAPGTDGKYFFTAGLEMPVATDRPPPDRDLVEGERVPRAWGLTRFLSRGTAADVEPESPGGAWVWAQGHSIYGRHEMQAGKARVTYYNDEPTQPFGRPEASLSAHAHGHGLWAIPVWMTLTNTNSLNFRDFAMRIFGYAIYGPAPGPYAGPLPAGKPRGGTAVPPVTTENRTPSGGGPGGNPPGAPGANSGGAGGAHPPAPSSGESGQPAVLPPGRVRRPPSEPNSSVAVPDLRGRPLGEARSRLSGLGLQPLVRPGTPAPTARLSGTVESLSPPAGSRAARGSEVMVRVHSPHVVVIRVPNLEGESLATAKKLLGEQGLTARIRPARPAPSADLSGKIASQAPAAGSVVEPGAPVVLSVYASFVDLRTVPNLVGRSVSQAKAWLQRLGLTWQLRPGRPAPAAALAGRIASQQPAQGMQVKVGSPVVLTLYSNFVQTIIVPSVRGLDASRAESTLRSAGLVPVRREAGAAPSAESSNRVTSQSPQAGSRVKIGANVAILAYGRYVAPRPPAVFRIERADHPGTIISGQQAGNLSVTWSGNPTFPVTMIYEPRAGWNCPMGGCATPRHVFQSPANPLIFPQVLSCQGYTDPDLYFDYQVELIDAKGLRTLPVSAPFHCLAGAAQWVSIGAGDCVGGDIGQTFDSAQPDPRRCNRGTEGTIAVCWDGARYSNPGRSGPWCTYKSVGANACTGGNRTGWIYECRAKAPPKRIGQVQPQRQPDSGCAALYRWWKANQCDHWGVEGKLFIPREKWAIHDECTSHMAKKVWCQDNRSWPPKGGNQ